MAESHHTHVRSRAEEQDCARDNARAARRLKIVRDLICKANNRRIFADRLDMIRGR